MKLEYRLNLCREFVTEIEEPAADKRQTVILDIATLVLPPAVQCTKEPVTVSCSRTRKLTFRIEFESGLRMCEQDVVTTESGLRRRALQQERVSRGTAAMQPP